MALIAGLGPTVSLLNLGRAQTADIRVAQEMPVRGPFVSSVTPTTARVHWIAPPDLDARLRLVDTAPEVRVAAPEPSPIPGRVEVRFSAAIENLRPDRGYRFEVGSGEARIEGRFRTPPEIGRRTPFHFVITGDTQHEPARIQMVAAGILREMPAFVLHTGDLSNDTRNWDLLGAEFFEPWRELLRHTTLWTARGNHEYGLEPYASVFGISPAVPWYSFDYGNLHVVVLDQWNVSGSERMEPERRTAMAEWLERDLVGARPRADWIIVAGHQPMFNVAAHGSEWGRETILPILYRHGVDIVIGGHSHLYERFIPIAPSGAHPIHFLVAGGGGAITYPPVPSPLLARVHAAPHYCLFRVDGERLELAVKGSDGVTLDRLILTKSNGALPPSLRSATVPLDDAIRLAKAFKGIAVSAPEWPQAGQTLALSISPRRFPSGSRVIFSRDPGGAWALEEAAFIVPELPPAAAATTTETAAETAAAPDPTNDDAEAAPPGAAIEPESWSLRATPPGVVQLGAQGFSPALTATVRIEHNGRVWITPSVPIGLHEFSLWNLLPETAAAAVPRAPRSPVIDGRLDEWQHIPARPAAAPDSPHRIRLAWSDDGLYGAVEAAQDTVRTDSRFPASADSVELRIEPDAARRLRLGSRGPGAIYLLWPEGEEDGGPAAVRRMGGRLPGGSIQAAWHRTAEGYTLEFRVPARTFTATAAGAESAAAESLRWQPGRKIGFDLLIRRDGRIVKQFAASDRVRGDETAPFFWGRLLLQE